MNSDGSKIARHKTAIRRPSFSLPIKCLLRDGLLPEDSTLFDYGCGHGQDLQLLREAGVECDGWDPVFRSGAERKTADVVNLGYVINVVEHPRERATVVRAAWDLCRQLLVVSAQVKFAASGEHAEYADGVLTSRGTFQKYYTQHELRGYLESELAADAIAAAPGVFYLFKDEAAKQQFLATRYHRRIAVPRKRISELRFEQNLDVLEPLMAALTQLGRLPGPEEFPQAAEVIQRFGSLNKAVALIRRVTEEQPWEEIAQRRTDGFTGWAHLQRRQQVPLDRSWCQQPRLDLRTERLRPIVPRRSPLPARDPTSTKPFPQLPTARANIAGPFNSLTLWQPVEDLRSPRVKHVPPTAASRRN